MLGCNKISFAQFSIYPCTCDVFDNLMPDTIGDLHEKQSNSKI